MSVTVTGTYSTTNSFDNTLRIGCFDDFTLSGVNQLSGYVR